MTFKSIDGIMTEIKYLPNSIREHVLKTHPAAAVLWDLLVYCDVREFTVYEALEACRNVVEMSVYRMYEGLKALKELKVVACKLIKQNRGRPVQLFRLTPVSIVLERWNLNRGMSDEIEPDAFASPKRYRAALHRMFIKRVRPDWSRKNLGKRLGVSGRATYNYEKMYKDIKVTARYEELEVVAELSYGFQEVALEHIPEKLERSRPCFLRVWEEVKLSAEKIREQELALMAYNEMEIKPLLRPRIYTTKLVERRYPCVRYLAARLLDKGYRVVRVRRLANLYEVVDEV
jgi:hypothetical protein